MISESAPTSTRRIGQALRQLRKQRNMTGGEVGERVGLSQSKISTIENGHLPFTRADIEKILNILDAPKTIRQQVDLWLSQQDMGNALFGKYSFQGTPIDILSLERQSQDLRIMTLGGIPALLQTPEYCRAVQVQQDKSESEIQAVLRRNDRRQSLLWSEAKHYHILIHEVALYTLLTSIPEQLDQLDRLERFTMLRDLELGVVTLEAGLPNVITGAFMLIDKAHLILEAGNMEPDTKDPARVTEYVDLFAALHTRARFGAEARTVIRKAFDYFSSQR